MITFARHERPCQYCSKPTRGRDDRGVATCQPCASIRAKGLQDAATRGRWAVG